MFNETSSSGSASKLPPIRLDFMSSVYPYILPLWRDGYLLTPPKKFLFDVAKLVNYLAGENAMWCDFATYLNKPLLVFGSRFVPEANKHISHKSCKFIINHRLLVKPNKLRKNYDPSIWLKEALSWFGFQFSRTKYDLVEGEFEFEATRPNSLPIRFNSEQWQHFFIQKRGTREVSIGHRKFSFKFYKHASLIICRKTYLQAMLIIFFMAPNHRGWSDSTKDFKYNNSAIIKCLESIGTHYPFADTKK
jgi:hypothetical protein